LAFWALRNEGRSPHTSTFALANPCYRRCFVSSAAATTTTAAFFCLSDRHGAVRVLAGCDFCLTRFFTASSLGFFFLFFSPLFSRGMGLLSLLLLSRANLASLMVCIYNSPAKDVPTRHSFT
jgi:hypothetical protein